MKKQFEGVTVTKHFRLFMVFVILALIYALLILLTPSDASVLMRYNISEARAKMLSLTFVLPYIAIWLTAFYGYARLKDYAQSIKDGVDGASLSKLADGLKFIALSLPIMAVVSSGSNLITRSRPDLMPTTTIITNYVDVVISFIAFALIIEGASGLMGIVKKKTYETSKKLFAALFIMLFTIFTYVTLTNPSRQFPAGGSRRAAYYLPDLLLMLTIIIPYFVNWYRGFHAAYYLGVYKREVKGVIYKDALGYLSVGLAAVIAGRVLMRVLTSMSTLFSSLTLRVVLIVLYLLLFLISVGFILIALGAKRLKRIEDV